MIRSLLMCTSAFAVLLSTGCAWIIFDSGIPGSGTIQTESRQLESFDRVHLSGFGDVTVVFGDEPGVEITTDDNLMAFVETIVVDGELNIEPTESVRPSAGLEFKITTPGLKHFKLSGAGDVDIVDYSGDTLMLDAAGAGSFHASGVAESVHLKMAGAGEASLADLVVKSATINLSGAGSASVNVVDSLNVNMAGACSVSYIGSPKVTQSISGIGSVTQIRDSNLETAEAE